MTRTLVASLGTSPGTVTATYYALYERNPEDLPDRVVVVATEAREAEECLKMIRHKFRHPDDHEPDGPRLEAALVEKVADLHDAPSTAAFQAKIAQVLRQERDRPGNQVWLSIAGGRKSMAALAALAAQIIGVDWMVHLYVVPELEQHGDINQLLQDSSWQPRCLHPNVGDYTLVDVPFFELAVEKGQLELLLQGQPDAFVHEIVRARPGILTRLPCDVVKAYWNYVGTHVPQPQYEELTIHVEPRPTPAADFPIVTHGEGTADVRGEMIPLFDPGKIADFVGLAAQPHLTETAQATLRALGRKIFDSLFSGKMLEAFWTKQGWATHCGKDVRLRLRFAPDARMEGLPLRRVPWELMSDDQEFLGLERRISIVRHLEAAQPAGMVMVAGPLRVLVAAANPKEYPLPEDVELRALYLGVQDLALRLAVLGLDDPPRTFAGLERALDDVSPHVVYFTGHGQPGGLVFETPDHTAEVHPAEEVGALLTRRNVRLVVLNACYGAQSSAPDLTSVAEALVAAGVPAVVAMQSAVLTGRRRDAPAVRFANEFFYHLAAGWPVDACVTAARIAIQKALPDSFQWALPVCFLRSGDGRLFAFRED